MSSINYHDRFFRAVSNTEAGEADADTRFHYRQAGNLVWATYQGGAIRFGTLTGTVDAAGRLDFAYQHVNQAGALMTGHCRSTPKLLADGRLRLHERWQWALGDRTQGESIIEEVLPAERDGVAGSARRSLQLTRLPQRFAVCRLSATSPLPNWAMHGGFLSFTRTDEELSIVCEEKFAPENIPAERGWACLKVQGPLEFGEIGILAGLARALAAAEISIFVVSTYNTDYLLVRAVQVDAAVTALMQAGYDVE
jgi:hypothetical protein